MGSEAHNACKTSLGGWALGLLALGYSGTRASQTSNHIQTTPKRGAKRCRLLKMEALARVTWIRIQEGCFASSLGLARKFP
ncbi:hypothetical protein I7I48_06576 [Histoplasma ohiense]|nr:hypothetical protein I7I48_06576 [Histoplasma ohiense (nom. inval.)]